MRLRHAFLTAGLIVACLLAALAGPLAPQAVASGPNRAVVVADSGTGVIVRGIEFSGDSISGLEALQLAGLAPVLQSFSGEGGAVCALQGVGCPSDDSCLTCDARGYYWAYWRAPGGAGAYTYSRVGAGATRVHDGDVEAWRWGTGAAPAFHSFASVFPATPPPPPPTTTTPGQGGGTTPVPGSGASDGGPSTSGATTATSAPAPGAPTTVVAAPGATTTSVVPTATTAPAAEGAATSSDGGATTDGADEIAFQAAQGDRADPAPSPKGWIASAALLALVLAAIGALIVRSRRHRAAEGPDPV